ncbi:cysteine desulfurase family protein [Mesorhizobium sp.]|uniref:cysteine desulfurase family protein n=1 Tax=Mesorhizobium sp. TaxID=1871066 RepID=UPI0025892F81|nr:cysteine desulfurase family protein [Mesorhizobium sp.]
MAVTSAYLDYQASAPIDPAVLAAMNQAYAIPGNPSAEEHIFGWRAREHVNIARRQVADLINALPEEVYFTSGASEANNIAILGAARNAPESRRRIVISAIEHKSVSRPARALENEGFYVDVLPVGRDGLVNLNALEGRLAADVAVISVMAVNSEIGTIQPTSSIATLGRAVGAFVHVDAAQALAAGPVDFRAWGADSLAISGHKICGPSGVGALVVAEDAPWQLKPISFGGGQEGGLRPGTVPVALCVGFGVACDLLGQHGQQERARISDMRSRLAEALRARGVDFAITAEPAPRHPGCLHIRLPGIDAADLLTRLQPHVGASTGSACNSGVLGPSDILLAIGMPYEEAAECIRLSLGRFTTLDEIEGAAVRIASAIGAQRHLASRIITGFNQNLA